MLNLNVFQIQMTWSPLRGLLKPPGGVKYPRRRVSVSIACVLSLACSCHLTLLRRLHCNRCRTGLVSVHETNPASHLFT